MTKQCGLHLISKLHIVLCQAINDLHFGQGNPAPTNSSTHHLNVDKTIDATLHLPPIYSNHRQLQRRVSDSHRELSLYLLQKTHAHTDLR